MPLQCCNISTSAAQCSKVHGLGWVLQERAHSSTLPFPPLQFSDSYIFPLFCAHVHLLDRDRLTAKLRLSSYTRITSAPPPLPRLSPSLSDNSSPPICHLSPLGHRRILQTLFDFVRSTAHSFLIAVPALAPERKLHSKQNKRTILSSNVSSRKLSHMNEAWLNLQPAGVTQRPMFLLNSYMKKAITDSSKSTKWSTLLKWDSIWQHDEALFFLYTSWEEMHFVRRS